MEDSVTEQITYNFLIFLKMKSLNIVVLIEWN